MNKFPFDKPKKHCHLNEYGGGSYMLCLLWAELEYDVKYAIWRRMRVSSKDEASKSSAITDEDDKDFLLRSFTDCVSTIKGKLKPYVTERSRMATDELLEAPADFNIPLQFEEGWLGSANVMLTAAHDYVVFHTLAELMALNNDTLAESYAVKANYSLNNLYNEANSFNLSESPLFTL